MFQYLCCTFDKMLKTDTKLFALMKTIPNNQNPGKLTNFSAANNKMSLIVRKPAFCLCENKDADRSNRLCFR